MLRLATGAAVIEDQFTRHRTRQLGTEILLDHAQRQIDPGAHPGRGPDLAVDDEDTVLLHLHLGKFGLQPAGEAPMRGDAPSVEQTGLGQDEGAGADRGDAAARRQGFAQIVQHAGRARFGLQRTGHDQRVEGWRGESGCIHPHAERAGQRPAILGHHRDVVERLARRHIGQFEGRQGGEAHHLEAGNGEETDFDHGDSPIMSLNEVYMTFKTKSSRPRVSSSNFRGDSSCRPPLSKGPP